jgi:protein-S-isoprenylcysteine O-methyltransferase Ste14
VQRTLWAMLALTLVQAAVLFGAAGRLDLPAFWTYIALVTVPTLASLPALQRRSPGLLEERMRPARSGRDRAGEAVLSVGTAAAWVVAGLDAGRFGWTRVPVAGQIAAMIAAALGLAWTGWAMWVNPFFSSVVRLQSDRAQTVIAAGPYACMRHPGYVGGIVFSLCSGPALGSWWALLPMLAVVVAMIRRTAIEDALLADGLPGYRDYARTVRFRLVPGLW